MDKSKTISIYYGVCKRREDGFDARLEINGKNICLGRFTDQVGAARAYDEYIKENNLNRRLNFPEPTPTSSIPNTRLIRLTQGKFAIVDEEDFQRANEYHWSAKKIGNVWYACRCDMVNGVNKTQFLHRFIMNADAEIIDHKNCDGLDNRKCNLRPCTFAQNGMNKRGKQNRKIEYKGVHSTGKSKFEATISTNKKTIHLGTYTTTVEAAMAYDTKAKELFGEFACLNFKQQII